MASAPSGAISDIVAIDLEDGTTRCSLRNNPDAEFWEFVAGFSPRDGVDIEDEERYTLRVTNADAETVLVDIEKNVSYEEHDPGVFCGGSCYSAYVALPSPSKR